MRCLLYAPGFSDAHREVYFFWDKTPYFVLDHLHTCAFSGMFMHRGRRSTRAPLFPQGRNSGFCRQASLGFQSRSDAIRAPATRDSNLGQTMLGRSSLLPANVAKPQSLPAIMFSRPTARAKRSIRCATSSGCSTSTVVCEITPEISSIPSGSFTVCHTCHSARGWVRCFE